MRITGGEAKGRRLKVYRHGQVRPTSDKIRQALFNILHHRLEVDWGGIRVLDLYAGSGSLGAEALSRGAHYACFIESDRRVLKTLRDNIEGVTRSVEGTFDIKHSSVKRFLLTPPPQAFDLIFMDPPYQNQETPHMLKKLLNGWVSNEGYVVIEHSRRIPLEVPLHWSLHFRREYGDTSVSICSVVLHNPIA